MRNGLFDSINPSMKFFVILLASILLIFTSSWKMNLFVFALSLFLLIFFSKASLLAFIKSFLPVILMVVASFYSGYINGNQAEHSPIDSALLLSSRVLAYIGLGFLFSFTTNKKALIMSLIDQCHLSPKFAYGILAAVNLIPTLQREWTEVNLAYRVRRKKVGILPFGPLFNSLVNGIRWSENVAMAMESKGFEGDRNRTYFLKIYVKPMDFLFLGIFLGIFLLGMIIFK